MQIFAWNFTQLLSDRIYTLLPSFVEIYLKITELCCFNQDNTAFLKVPNVTQSWLQANCPAFVAKNEWPPNSPDLNPLDYTVWSAMVQQYHKLQLKTIDEWEVVVQTICEELPYEHINRRWRTSPITRLPVWLLMVVTSTICSNSAHLKIYTSSSYLIANKPALFRATNRLPGRTALWTLRSVRCFGRNSIL